MLLRVYFFFEIFTFLNGLGLARQLNLKRDIRDTKLSSKVLLHEKGLVKKRFWLKSFHQHILTPTLASFEPRTQPATVVL